MTIKTVVTKLFTYFSYLKTENTEISGFISKQKEKYAAASKMAYTDGIDWQGSEDSSHWNVYTL